MKTEWEQEKEAGEDWGPKKEGDKPEMTKRPSTCHRCMTGDEHLFLSETDWVCSKCYEKEMGVEP